MAEKSKEFRWGLIGPGRIARRFAAGLEVIPDAHLHAVGSRDLQRASDFADEFSAPEFYGSYQEMLDSSDLDAVYVATPHNFHFDHTKMCIEAGMPVLCEKPFTVNASESQELVDIARKNGIFLMEALWSRYLPIWRKVRELVDGGEIGDVLILDSRFGIKFPRDLSGRVLNPSLAGGALLDIGIYPIALSQWVFDADPEDVKVHGLLGDTGVDELLSVSMKYSGNRVSQFNSTTLAATQNDFYIYGTEAYLRIHANFWDGQRLSIVKGENAAMQHFPYRATGFEYETEEAIRCIRQGLLESPDMSHEHTLANMRLMDGIRREIGLKYPFEE